MAEENEDGQNDLENAAKAWKNTFIKSTKGYNSDDCFVKKLLF